jgi:hypothetical protein
VLYIRLENFIPVEVSTEHPKGPASIWAMQPKGGDWHDLENVGSGWITRNDIGSYAYAFTLASLLTDKYKAEQRTFLATDATESTSPRYDVIEAPKVGDPVSKSFNGDSYPEGVITKITPTWQITTSTGAKFRRYKNTAGFRQAGRGFWMVGGHRDERNPSY